MSNPFLRRATEYFKDDAAFLSIVCPDPLELLLHNWKKEELYFDVLTRLIGNPGSGKTMLATLVEFRLTERVLLQSRDPNYKALAKVLSSCGFTDGKSPKILAARLPMEAEYRDYWELPYDETVRTRLVYSLIQARCITGFIRNLLANETRRIEDIRFVFAEGADTHIEKLGGTDTKAIYERAREVEDAVYEVGQSLFPLGPEDISPRAQEPYRPFDAIEKIRISWKGETIELKPLAILDDVHALHPDQLDLLTRHLIRRETKIARWMMLREDTLDPKSVIDGRAEYVGHKLYRDYLDIRFQMKNQRNAERNSFRKFASEMAGRYLRKTTILDDAGHDRLGPLLLTNVNELPPGKFNDLKDRIDRDQDTLDVKPARRKSIEKEIDNYCSSPKAEDISPEVRLGMTRVLMHRYHNRVKDQNFDLFGDLGPEPKTELHANLGVADAAKIYLYKEFERPLHFGLTAVCDASNENAETFLQLAGELVALLESRVISRANPIMLTPKKQNDCLRDTASKIISAWQFPYASLVRRMIHELAQKCLLDTHKPNAQNGAGTNAIAILETEYDSLDDESQTLHILKYAVAYGALLPVEDHKQGGKLWRKFELAGVVCLKYGLTLKRGGFLPSTLKDIEKAIGGGQNDQA